MAWDDLPPVDVRAFEGKTILRVEAPHKYGRTKAVTLYFTDGTAVEISYWASYADDDCLEVDWEVDWQEGRKRGTKPSDSAPAREGNAS